jgi:iron complex transport system substrate-binding protein
VLPTWAIPAVLLMNAAFAGLSAPAAAEPPPPARVVSINLCTDQLAMLLAAPGQLVSVSRLARDPHSSAMVAEAAAYPANHGGAEEVFLLHPDLVLAGTYTALGSVDLLKRLGVRVVQLPPVTALDQVPEHILLVGQALGREEAARALAARFTADLEALRLDLPPRTAALYHPSGYTTGAGTLSDDILAHVGLSNLAASEGLAGGGILPLERLVMARPAVVVTSTRYPGASHAEEILVHPALRDIRESAAISVFSDPDWVCGTPSVLRAVAQMRAAREALP